MPPSPHAIPPSRLQSPPATLLGFALPRPARGMATRARPAGTRLPQAPARASQSSVHNVGVRAHLMLPGAWS